MSAKKSGWKKLTSTWNRICGIPNPPPIQLTGRELSYLRTLVICHLVQLETSKVEVDQTYKNTAETTHTKLLYAQRDWFNDIENDDITGKPMTMSFKVTGDKPIPDMNKVKTGPAK